jgi:predicted nucleic acid-binding protein
MSIVVDSSAVIHVLLGLGGSDLLSILVSGEAVAPHVIDLEVLHTLRNSVVRARASEVDLREAVATYASFHIERYAVYALINRIWELRRNIRTYDASYVALAEMLRVPLLTRDRALANSSGHTATIQYID